LEAVSGELSFFTLPNCFELFGFDLLVDDAWHVWLLEARSSAPSHQCKSCADACLSLACARSAQWLSLQSRHWRSALWAAAIAQPGPGTAARQAVRSTQPRRAARRRPTRSRTWRRRARGCARWWPGWWRARSRWWLTRSRRARRAQRGPALA